VPDLPVVERVVPSPKPKVKEEPLVPSLMGMRQAKLNEMIDRARGQR
jgi:hypothetical protein